jgi:hypothetical protein
MTWCQALGRRSRTMAAGIRLGVSVFRADDSPFQVELPSGSHQRGRRTSGLRALTLPTTRTDSRRTPAAVVNALGGSPRSSPTPADYVRTPRTCNSRQSLTPSVGGATSVSSFVSGIRYMAVVEYGCSPAHEPLTARSRRTRSRQAGVMRGPPPIGGPLRPHFAVSQESWRLVLCP